MKHLAGKTAGFTLLEVVGSTSLLAVVAGAVALAMDSSSRAFRTGATAASLDSSTLRVMDELCKGLLATSKKNVSPTPVSPFSSSQLEFQRGVGTLDDAIVWGLLERIELQANPGEPDDDQDNDGDGLIDERRIVWITDPGGPKESERVLCSDVAEYLEGEVPNGLDDNGNGLIDELGLSFNHGDNGVTIQLTVQNLGPGGVMMERTVRKTNVFRNQGEAMQ